MHRSRCIATHRARGEKTAQELNESVTAARVFFYDSPRSAGSVGAGFFPEQRRRAVNHYLFLCFTLSSGGERNERGSDGTERVGKKGTRERAKVGGKRMLRRAPRARVIITDFPDLILRTVTRHNSLTQIAHERM